MSNPTVEETAREWMEAEDKFTLSANYTIHGDEAEALRRAAMEAQGRCRTALARLEGVDDWCCPNCFTHTRHEVGDARCMDAARKHNGAVEAQNAVDAFLTAMRSVVPDHVGAVAMYRDFLDARAFGSLMEARTTLRKALRRSREFSHGKAPQA